MLSNTSTGVKYDSQIPTTICERSFTCIWVVLRENKHWRPAWWRQCQSIRLLHQCLLLSTTSLKYANTLLHQGSSTYFIHFSWISYQKCVPNSYRGQGNVVYRRPNLVWKTCLYGCVCDSRIVMSNSLKHQGLDPARFLCPWNSPDENTGVDCHFLLQGIFPIQGLNPSLLASLVSQTVKNLPAMQETWI